MHNDKAKRKINKFHLCSAFHSSKNPALWNLGEREREGGGGAAAVSPHSAACIMLRSIRLHTFLNSNLLLHCLRDSQNNNKFAVLSIDALGVGFSL